MKANNNLHKAKAAKNDEFYTRLEDIENEMQYYEDHFRNKTILCNCDDPRESKFFHYFSYNFERLGLKKLIASCYKSQDQELFSQHDSDKSIYAIYAGDRNGNRLPDANEIEVHEFNGDGDFRSKECIELLKEADIVVTNPPFSLFREYVSQLVEYNKDFLIVGSMNAISYKETFGLIKENRLWLGVNNLKEFITPNGEIKKFGNINWYTNLDHAKRNRKLRFTEKYSTDKHPTYDNYKAINIDKVIDIPVDYNGIMGVPISFLSKYNPDQFKILGLTNGRSDFEVGPSKKYLNAIQVNRDGTTTSGSKVNTRATLTTDNPSGIYYTADNAKKLAIVYARILIKKK